MKTVLSVIGLSLLVTAGSFALASSGAASEQVAKPTEKAEEPTIDCATQVWPNFSWSCLRNADQAINVRLVAVTRR